MNRVYSRAPVIALDYSERHKAKEKELLIDYDNGNIYVVSKDDKSVIFDITAKIYEQLESMKGDNIVITIEGIGEVNLTEILKQLQQGINDSVQAIDTGKEANYVAKENILDNKSLVAINKTMQLVGFSEADALMMPRKGKDGALEWIEMPQIIDPGSSGGGSTYPPGVIPPSNPDDSEKGECFIIEPVNDKLYLRASRRQKTLYLDKNCKVILPRTLDEFSEINWYLISPKDFQPLLSFGINVLWDDMNNTQPKANSHHVYIFKSWDYGETWFGKLEHYNRVLAPPEADTGDVVSKEYLEQNYYDKNYIDDSYLDKNQISDEYYNKPEVDDMVSWKKEDQDSGAFLNKLPKYMRGDK